jgi:bacillopeptidase F
MSLQLFIKISLTSLYVLFFLTLHAQEATNEKLSPELAFDLKNGLPDQKHKIIIILKDQVDVKKLEEQVLRSLPTRDLQIKSLLDALQVKAERTQEKLIADISGSPFLTPNSIKTFWISNLISLEAQAPLINNLLQHPAIAGIEKDAILVSHHKESIKKTSFIPNGKEIGLSAINAPALWKLGYTGYGRKVLIIDNGQDNAHPALRNQFLYNHVPLSQAYTSLENQDFCSEHGTHVAGIVAGLDRLTRDTIGVAFNAQWMGVPLSLKNADGTECKLKAATQSDAIGGMQWALNPDRNNNTSSDIPDVINNSWGSPPGKFNVSACFTSAYLNIFTTMQNAGIAIVFSSGNEGPDSLTVSFPAVVANDVVMPFSVGAVNAKVSGFPITSFSGSGPSVCLPTNEPLGIKPEVVAPGQEIRSAINGNAYGSLSGTSMAAPHVSGAILLLKEAFPNVSPLRIVRALYDSASDLGAIGEDNKYGRGIIDVKAAFDLLRSQGLVPADPIKSPQDLTLLDVKTRTENCGNQFRGTLTVEHAGAVPVSTFNIVLKNAVSGALLKSVPWTGSLFPGQRMEIILSSIDLPSGKYDIQFGIELPNGTADLRFLDNYLKIPVLVSTEANLPVASADATIICRNTKAVLRAKEDQNEEIRWYNKEYDGSQITKGKVFQTGLLTTDTTFFAELVYLKKLGMSDPDQGEKSFSETSGGIVFNCLAPFLLKQVTVYTESVGPRGFILRAPDGKIQQKIINLSKIGENVVVLNFTVTPGNGYKLERSLGKSLSITSTMSAYPYRIPGILDLLYSDNTNPKIYPYFYQWQIEYPSACGRTPVSTKILNSAQNLTVGFSPNAGSFPLINGKATVNFKGTAAGSSQVNWNFGDGNVSTELNPSNEFKIPGEYGISFSGIAQEGCQVMTLGYINITGTATPNREVTMPSGTLTLFPNPNAGQFYIQPHFNKRTRLEGKLLDATGKELSSFRWENILDQPFQVSLHDTLLPGTYFWYFRSENREATLPMMIQHP